MAVVGKAVRKPGSRRGPVRDKKGGYTYHETYVVRTNNVNDDGQVVEKASGLPTPNSGYSEDAAAVVTLISPQQSSEHDTVWYVEVTWTYVPPGTGDPGSTPGSNTFLLTTRNWSTVAYQETIQKDLDGKKFVNSAGDPFDPPPLLLKYNQILTMTMNRLSYNATEAAKYINAINTDAIGVDGATFPPFSGLIIDYNGQMDFLSPEVPYFRMVIAIEFNEDLWHPLRVLDRGARHKVLGQQGLVLAKDSSEVTFMGNILLNGNGFPLEESFDEPEWRDFKVYKQLAFAPLNLPLG